MNALPELVRVGPYTYRVTTAKADWKKYGPKEDVWGYIDHEAGVILVGVFPNTSLTRSTLLHEVLHACAYATGQIGDELRNEEQWVSSTAPLLIDALRRSPGLVQYLAVDD